MTPEEKQARYEASLKQLRHMIIDWVDENPTIVRYPEFFADHVVTYANNLLNHEVEV